MLPGREPVTLVHGCMTFPTTRRIAEAAFNPE